LIEKNVLHRDEDRGSRKGEPRRGKTPGGTPPRKPPLQGGRPFRTLAFWAFVALLSLVAFRMYQGSFMAPQRIEISYTRFIAEVEKGNIQDVQIIEKLVTGDLKAEASIKIGAHEVPFKAFKTNILGDGSDLPDRVWKTNPGIEVEVRNPSFNWVSVLIGWLPVVFVLVLWLFMVRQVQSGGSAALKFGKTKARVLLESSPKVTFKDVAGCDEAKQELQEVIEFLKEPQKFQRLGGRIPKGALLLGPPGSGKTLLAKAVAGEAGVPFFSMSGSDFVEMFVGVGASRVRDLFEQGKRNAPCLTGDAVVTLSGGKQITIQEMFDKKMVGVRVPAMVAGEFRFEDATVIGMTRKRCTDLYEVTTATSSIKATGNHLFPVLRGQGFEWVRVDELREGECVAAPRVIGTDSHPPYFHDFLPDETLVHFKGDAPGQRHARLGEVRREISRRHSEIERLSIGRGGYGSSYLERVPLHVHEEMAYVCGLLASDGYYRAMGDRSITFVNTELALHECLRESLENLFGYSPKRHLNKKHFDTVLPRGTYPQSLKDCYTTFINNLLLCNALRAFQGRILEMPSYMVACWLRGVFDGDGCVRVSRDAPQVIISAWNPSANQLIRDALLRIGIVTSKSPAAHGGMDGNICITGRASVRAFAGKVQSDHPAKATKLHRVIAHLQESETSSSRLDCIPARGMIRAARESLGMGQRAFRRGHYVSSYERGLVTPSRTSLQSVVAEMEAWSETQGVPLTHEAADLRDLTESAVLWSRIENIKRVEPVEFVYDLCLDRHNCFIANNLVVHNCIVFVDEIDAVGRHRGAGLGGGHDEREQTLNQLLVEMDGFESNEGVIMIAATNRPDVLDPALLRPGRFDRQIVVDWPDVRGREGILRVHTRKIPLSDDVDLKQIARGTPGLAGADLANIVNEAALLAARRNRKKVTQRDFEDAKDKVMLGMERRSLVMTEQERRSTAYHEAGHALVGWLLPGSDPVNKVTIIPRGRALGITSWVPQEERHNRSKEDLERMLGHMMGGRAAELLVFNHLTTGAISDIEQATETARNMVCRYGMSDALGPLTFGKKEEMVFLGKEIATHKDYSEQTAVLIDQEVRRIIESSYNLAMQVLRDNMDKLHLLANTLLEREVLDGDEMDRVLRGEKLPPLRPAVEPELASETAASAQEPPRDAAGQKLESFPPPEPRPAGA
jgi:ATP-dependent metalloprotease FtsH